MSMHHVDNQDYQSPIVRFGMWFFGGLLILIGPFAGYFVVVGILEAEASANWPTTKGKMVKTAIEEQKRTETRGGVSQVKVSYRPDLQYSYEVAGKWYVGYRIGIDTVWFRTKQEADDVVGRYAANRDFDVYYDPENAKNSVLEPGVSSRSYWKLAIPPAMLLIGIAVCWGAHHLGKNAVEDKRQGTKKPVPPTE
jgi:hypothetical protein